MCGSTKERAPQADNEEEDGASDRFASGGTEDGHQPRAHGAVRHVGIGCNLTLKLRRPAPGNGGAAIPTRALAGEGITRSRGPVALNQDMPAVRATGAIQVSHLSS